MQRQPGTNTVEIVKREYSEAGLVTISATLFLLVYAFELAGWHTNPYIGIVFFLVLLLWLGSREVVADDLSVGQLVSFLGYGLYLIGPIRTFFEFAQKVTRAMVSARKAIAIFEPLLADLERTLGAEHPHTLSTRGNLANAYQDAGRTEDAIADAAQRRAEKRDGPLGTAGSPQQQAIAGVNLQRVRFDVDAGFVAAGNQTLREATNRPILARWRRPSEAAGQTLSAAPGVTNLNLAPLHATFEFVGDDDTLVLLRDCGVDLAQGYHLGRPAPAHQLVDAFADAAERAIAAGTDCGPVLQQIAALCQEFDSKKKAFDGYCQAVQTGVDGDYKAMFEGMKAAFGGDPFQKVGDPPPFTGENGFLDEAVDTMLLVLAQAAAWGQTNGVPASVDPSGFQISDCTNPRGRRILGPEDA